MSEPMGPRRPLPKSVYVRRRVTVVVIAVVAIGVLIWAFAPKGGTAIAANPRQTSVTSATPGPTAGPTDNATTETGATAVGPTPGPTAATPGEPATNASGDACDPSKIAITANTDKTEYQSGEPVQISLTLTNNSSQDCVIAAGSDQQVLTITSPTASGDEAYWTSTDCQTDAAPQNVVLKAGIPISTPAITWDRHRSIAGDCDPAAVAARPIVGGGGASFDLTVKVGTLTSAKHRFYLY